MKIPKPKIILGYIKGLLKQVSSYDYKQIPKKITYILNSIKHYDYKPLFIKIKSFNYKDPKAYKECIKNKEFRKRLIWALIIIVALMAVRGCVDRPKKEVIRPRPVTTGLVCKKDVPIYIGSFGTLSALEDVDIRSQATGQIMAAHFTEGDEVKKGDLLFTVDPSEYDARLRKAEATLAKDIAELKLKNDTLQRNKILIEKDLISVQDFETYQTEVAAAKAAVDLDRAEVELAKIDLAYCYIASPIDGLTGKRLVDPGNIVTADDGPVLVNVKTIDPFYLDFTVSEKVLDFVRQAQAKGNLNVEIWTEDKSEPRNGELIFLDNTVDDKTGTVLLRAIAPNTDRKLWGGEFVTVRLVLEIQKDATVAPSAAVRVGQKGHYLFVITEDNKADLRQVEIGLREGDYIIIKSGVSAGEKVATEGQLGLSPGAPVIERPVDTKKG